jgi:hypothetical protein
MLFVNEYIGNTPLPCHFQQSSLDISAVRHFIELKDLEFNSKIFKNTYGPNAKWAIALGEYDNLKKRKSVAPKQKTD